MIVSSPVLTAEVNGDALKVGCGYAPKCLPVSYWHSATHSRWGHIVVCSKHYAAAYMGTWLMVVDVSDGTVLQVICKHFH